MNWIEHGLAVALVALALDSLIGWPDWLYRRVTHPVVWLGALIDALDRRINTGGARVWRGVIGALFVIAAASLPALLIACALRPLPFGWLIEGILAWPLVAARSLADHVAAVVRPLQAGDITDARHAVSMIVGRDVSRADEPMIARAALESLAENSSDGVIAPLFWACLGGLTGIAAYKAINTLDSMIGHRTPRHAEFGRFAARLDDLVNLPAARLTGALFALAALSRRALACMIADAHRHRSPNAGWPEAAMAGALGVRLSGPRIYADRIADEPWLNGTARDPGAGELAAGLRLYRRTIALLAALMAAVLII